MMKGKNKDKENVRLDSDSSQFTISELEAHARINNRCYQKHKKGSIKYM